MLMDIAGQVALVTGSAHRVGKAIALELARHGAHIMVHYNSAPEDTVRETVREIKSVGVDAFAVQADVSRPDGVALLFDKVREHFGRLHILVNSASNFQKRRILDVTLEEWEETLRINTTGPLLCIQAAVPLMRQNNPSGGAIINICDHGALKPWPDYAHHGVSKAALYMLSQVCAVSLGPDVRVSAVIPGAVLKPSDYSEDMWQKNAQRTPIQRPGSAEDVARAVAYLVREDYLTGAVLHVDGGEHLQP